jgi:hypothetical protein
VRLSAAKAVGSLVLSHPVAAEARPWHAAALLQSACLDIEQSSSEPAQLAPWSILGATQQQQQQQPEDAQRYDVPLSLEQVTALAQALLFQETAEEVQVGKHWAC